MGEFADSELKITDKKNAEQIIEQADDKEKAEIIQNKNQALQKKICAITSAKKDITAEELSSALEGGEVRIPLDAQKFEDAKQAGFADEEYSQFKQIFKNLSEEQKANFIKASTILSYYWDDYSSCGKTKIKR